MTLIPLPAQPAGTPWPTAEWPEGEPLAGAAAAHLDSAFAEGAMERLGRTDALLVVRDGRIIYERYGEGLTAENTFPSWSKAKSMTHALTGLLVGDGLVDIHAPADAPEWRTPGDPRGAITLDQLLRMSSGLKFTEEYGPDAPSDVIAMLFGEGQGDVAAFAASFPLAHQPDAVMSYSSGTTNIISRALGRALGQQGADFEAFMRARLFAPIGMTSPIPKFDDAGTFIGSSFCFCTARDFARFGLLYLRDGVWEDRRLLPEGWVDYARTRTTAAHDDAEQYGAQWWLGIGGPGSFSANGYDGQYTVLVPDLDVVLVRHGGTPAALKDNLRAFIGEAVQGLRDATP
ncbi:MAG: beta-lactamase family protein [Caulobacter sp.]|nr:beta-lactamase family protein [Caulobacter sp.]